MRPNTIHNIHGIVAVLFAVLAIAILKVM